MTLTLILSVTLSLFTGGIIGWLLQNKKGRQLKEKNIEFERLVFEKNSELTNLQNSINEKVELFRQNIINIEKQVSSEREKNFNLGSNLAKAEQLNLSLNEKLEDQKKETEDLQKKFLSEFENLAGRILKQNTVEFNENNQKNISDILNPLKEKISAFEKQVHETYEKGIKDQTDLKAELKKLQDLNINISKEANDLTKALKGDQKKQGNWGEFVLERILERSGLIKGEEYDTQFSTRNDEGDILRPDVIIKLPENKHVIIDSKVSLVAYEQYVNTENQEERERNIKLHIESIKSHVKGLSEKSYAHAVAINSPDFVLMFMPIESSFSIAVQQDIELFNFAWDRRVVIVSPSTLLATLKTIESIWKREKQTQNAIEIATEGGKLYDKFAGLVEDLKRLGNQLDTVQKTYKEANKKLYEGSGNLIGKVYKLRQLGAKTTKNLPEIFMLDDDLNSGSNES